jgi:RimJ/RimL family protein N-acetyltransferase
VNVTAFPKRGARKERCYIHGFIEALEGNVLVLETERLILRDFIEEDWEPLNALMTDPEVKRYSYFASWDDAEHREWLVWLVQDVDNQNRDAYSANFV